MTAKCSRCAPTLVKVAKIIEAEGWTANHPRPEDIVAKWRPLSKAQAQSDPAIVRGVTRQKWPGLAVKDLGGKKGQGMYKYSKIHPKHDYNYIMDSTVMTPSF